MHFYGELWVSCLLSNALKSKDGADSIGMYTHIVVLYIYIYIYIYIIYIYLQVARMPRIIHFIFRKTVAKKERGKRKDEGGERKKKAGGKGREIKKKNENVGMKEKYENK